MKIYTLIHNWISKLYKFSWNGQYSTKLILLYYEYIWTDSDKYQKIIRIDNDMYKLYSLQGQR